MIILIVGLLVCVGVAVAVVGLVAIPARREGREVLTLRGEDLMATLRDRTETVVDKVTPGTSTDDTPAEAESRDLLEAIVVPAAGEPVEAPKATTAS